jgi:DNA-binding transcriptional LysR family regulator
MEMLQLRYFYDSAMGESFSKTAQKYMVPVSSVSASVKRLEQELGVTLFERTGNRVLLNEKGRQFLSVVSNTLSQLDMGVSALSAGPAQKETLTILVRCIRQTIVRQTLNFQKLYPSVFFKLAFEDTPENYDKYDLIISTPSEDLSNYEHFRLREYAIRVEALETDPLCQRTVTLDQLRDRLFVTTNTQRGSFEIFSHACKRKGFTPKVFLECDDYNCRNLAVMSGTCLGLTYGNTMSSSLPNVQFLNVSDFNARTECDVYYKKENYSGNVKLFLDLLKNSAM